MRTPCLAGTLSCAALCGAVGADVINVGAGESIQAAIDLAQDGDEVVVAPGTYPGSIDFNGKAITVRSSGGPAVTAIDGQGADTTVRCTSAEGPGTVLEGFTITGGANVSGGGMRIDQGSPVIRNCTFTANTATYGGALYTLDAAPLVVGCTFLENVTLQRAGAIYNNGGGPVVVDCVFVRNESSSGGAIYNSSASPTLTNCVFNGNTAQFGGAIFNISASYPVLINCTLAGNAAGSGGALFNNTGAPALINCTLSGNSGSGGGLATLFGNPVLTNCVLWGNQPDQILADTATVLYSCVQGGFAGTGNIGADPSLVRAPDPGLDAQWGTPDDDYGNLRLSVGSSCADAGNNWGLPADDADYDGDGNTAELFPVDLAGEPRLSADPADFDPGCGVPVILDMGAYESAGGPEEVLVADVTGDGVVNVLDLLALLGDWNGDPQTTNCVLDLDLDGTIGVSDLLIMLAYWSG